MTRPNLYFLPDKKFYSVHTYAEEYKISLAVASKKLKRLVKSGEAKFVRRNNCNKGA